MKAEPDLENGKCEMEKEKRKSKKKREKRNMGKVKWKMEGRRLPVFEKQRLVEDQIKDWANKGITEMKLIAGIKSLC